MVVFRSRSIQFLRRFVPCCDVIIASQYADSEKEMWRLGGDARDKEKI